MTFLGADTEALRAHAEATRTGAARIGERIDALVGLVDGVTWSGPDAEAFRAEARGTFARAQSDAEQLTARADELAEHADEQDRVSADDGGASGGPAAGDGGPSDAGKVQDPGDAEGTEPADDGIPEDDESLDPQNSGQGAIADCYLLAPLQSIAQQDPDFLREHVSEVEPGVYEVTLYDEDGRPVVYRVTSVQDDGVRGEDGEQTLYSLYERAYKMHLEASGEDIDFGRTEDAMQTITGQDAHYYSHDDAPSLDEIADAVDAGRLVSADTGGIDDPSHDQIAGQHAYTVTAVDREAGTVTVTNPWRAGDPDAPKNVTMTYEEYVETFGSTSVGRTDEPGFWERIGIGGTI